ncbi:MAG: DUF4833 domain-containing protein [Myxococcaceae bacterium]|nr:DUF4833 domain-containing protein [Myxococcaceae bacterium]
MKFVSKLAVLLTGVTAVTAAADEPVFGATDIPTVFFFSKSDDKNRVDYGLKLDASCQPVGDEPLFPYWREFETQPPGLHTHTLKFFEYAGYGVADQRVKKLEGGKSEIAVKLKALPRDIVVTVEKGEGGRCVATARAVIGGSPNVQLLSAYIKLKSGWSVEYVEVKGRTNDGRNLAERLMP